MNIGVFAKLPEYHSFSRVVCATPNIQIVQDARHRILAWGCEMGVSCKYTWRTEQLV